ncbi:MAG: hypothetical protein ACM3H8_09310 [Sphingobacteriales bacterium]
MNNYCTLATYKDTTRESRDSYFKYIASSDRVTSTSKEDLNKTDFGAGIGAGYLFGESGPGAYV